MNVSNLKATLSVILVIMNTLAVAETHEDFERRVKKDLSSVDADSIAAIKVVYLSGDVGPWMNTGMTINKGDRITTFAQGQRMLSFAHNLSFEADLALWKRVGHESEIFRGPSAHTFEAVTNGQLELKLYPTIRWLGETGDYDGEPPANSVDSGGGVSVLIIRWNPDVEIVDELRKISGPSGNPDWVESTVASIDDGSDSPPQGWRFLHELGPSKIWSEDPEPRGNNAPGQAINAHIDNDVSIITYETDMPLTQSTTLNWKWKLDDIPGLVAENTALAHDYLSIAVAFDNGQDLTYYWSKELGVGEHFACPLPGWSFRETHIVARTGEAEIGKWISEKKSILDDYKLAVDGDIPTRITGVWLIAVGIFNKVQGAGSFGDIRLVDGNQELQVY